MKSTSRAVYDELVSRGVEVHHTMVSGNTFMAFMRGGKLRTMSGVSVDLSSSSARTICNQKELTAFIANIMGVKIPATMVYKDEPTSLEFLNKYKKIVVKPTDGAHGNGVSTNITTADELKKAILRARSFRPDAEVILQQHVYGHDYRLLVIDNEVVAVSERIPASVIGDGVSSIAHLILLENQNNPLRGENYEKALNYINIDAAFQYLGERLQEVPEKDVVVQVVGTANMGTGGKATNMTDSIPAEMIKEAERITVAIGAFTCGVDFMYDSDKKEWYLIELNASPSFGLHESPSEGESIGVTKIFVDKVLARYDADILTKTDK